jgi:iron complex transport system ATP-binding protein
VAEERDILELDDVSVKYAGCARSALAGVSLSVRPGEVIAILGPNGAGKSSLLRVAGGLLDATAGAVRAFGCDLRSVDRQQAARLFALVSQTEIPPIGFCVRQVVAMGRAPHQGRWMLERKSDVAAVERALQRCDLAPMADRPVERLSGGEQRRVAIARALAQEPRVLLFDEPTAFFDIRHRLELGALIADLTARDRIASLVVMHDLDEAARLATRVLLLREGGVVALGSPRVVMTKKNLSDAFRADVDVGIHEATGVPYFVPSIRAHAE